MVRNLRNNKGAAFVKISPDEFLSLTTHVPVQEWIDVFARDETRTLDEYNRWAREGKITVGPFLKVRKDTGKVMGHEGRHRALALKDAGGEWFLAGIKLADKEGIPYRDQGPDDVPVMFKGEFRRTIEIQHGAWPIDTVLEAAEEIQRRRLSE